MQASNVKNDRKCRLVVAIMQASGVILQASNVMRFPETLYPCTFPAILFGGRYKKSSIRTL